MICEGKTGAFCLPILQITWETLKDLQGGGGKTTADGKKGDATTPLHQPWAMSFFDRGPALAVTPDGNYLCLCCGTTNGLRVGLNLNTALDPGFTLILEEKIYISSFPFKLQFFHILLPVKSYFFKF
jgi:hypothetical protein